MRSRHALRLSACALTSRRSGGLAAAPEAAPAAAVDAGALAPMSEAPAQGAGYGSDSEMGAGEGLGLTRRNRSLRHLRDSRRKSSSFTLCARDPDLLRCLEYSTCVMLASVYVNPKANSETALL